MSGIQMSLGLVQVGTGSIEANLLELTNGQFELVLDSNIATITISAPAQYAGVYTLDSADLDTGPAALVPPALSGQASVGGTLTVLPGIWAYDIPGGAPAISRQWQADGADVPGATGTTFVVTADLVGQEIGCVETGTNSTGTRMSASATETATSLVLFDATAAPVYLSDMLDMGQVPGGRRVQQTSSSGGVYRFATAELELGRSYRMTGTMVLDSPSSAGGRFTLSRNPDGSGGDLFNVLYRYIFGSGPNAIDETFTNQVATSTFHFGAFVRQDTGSGSNVDIVDFSLQEI